MILGILSRAGTPNTVDMLCFKTRVLVNKGKIPRSYDERDVFNVLGMLRRLGLVKRTLNEDSNYCYLLNECEIVSVFE